MEDVREWGLFLELYNICVLIFKETASFCEKKLSRFDIIWQNCKHCYFCEHYLLISTCRAQDSTQIVALGGVGDDIATPDPLNYKGRWWVWSGKELQSLTLLASRYFHVLGWMNYRPWQTPHLSSLPTPFPTLSHLKGFSDSWIYWLLWSLYWAWTSRWWIRLFPNTKSLF